MNAFQHTTGLALIGLISSCATFAPNERSELNAGLPDRFSLYSETGPDAAGRWWENLQSEELNRLIDEALTNSPSIQQAWARLVQADAVARKSGVARYPSLGYEGRAGANWTKDGTNDPVESYKAGLNLSYELDLWGRIKSQHEAAALDAEASREQLHTAALTLSSRVALTWSGLISRRLQTELLRKQLEANLTSLELIELRFKQSLASSLEVFQQRQSVAATQALIPRAELAETLQQNELAALLGRMDFKSLNIEQNQLPAAAPLPSIGIPADLLANRPDIRAAGLKLQAADWQVSAARADRLPALRLTGSIDDTSNNIESLFNNWSANLAAGITGPIFEGGKRKAETARARAVAEERLAAYRETVLNAIREVEDALASDRKQQDYLVRLEERLTAARQSHEESIYRYRNGMVEYTTVLIQLNALQNVERDYVQARYDQLHHRINLYKALGGNWPAELPTPN